VTTSQTAQIHWLFTCSSNRRGNR